MAFDPAARLHAVGFGLREGQVELRRCSTADVTAAVGLRDRVAATVGARAVDVEPIGSMSVVDLLAKPMVDLAIGVARSCDVPDLLACLGAAGWTYRGDSGDQGGHILMLDVTPNVRVAHAHIVEHGGRQWTAYLALRDLLRSHAWARRRYESEKRRLAERYADDRVSYTTGKDGVIAELLAVAAS